MADRKLSFFSRTLGQAFGKMLLLPALLGLATGIRAQDTCDSAIFIHNYPVRNASAYFGLFRAVEGYRPGPERPLPWPFSGDTDTRYPSLDFCPEDPDDRLVRLIEVPAQTSFQSGTLTLVTRNIAAAKEAASALAVGSIRASEFKGRASLYFSDVNGNEFFVWEYPGPPGL